MVKSLWEVMNDIKEFFGLSKDLHLSIGRKVSPIYLVNPVPNYKTIDRESNVLVQNTWVQLCNINNARVYEIVFEMQTANEDIELRIVVDEEDETLTQAAAVAGQTYFVNPDTDPANSNNFVIATSGNAYRRAFLLECRNIKIYIRKTTANGANAMQTKIGYACW